jgi:antitoxin PrlF
MDEHLPRTKVAERLLTRPTGATMREIMAATGGGPQYNDLKRLAARGYTIRRVKEGSETRYFADPPATPSFEATVTSKGQVTIPKEIRDHLGLRTGGKLQFTLDSDGRVVVTPTMLSVRRLFGILGKPPRSATLEDMDEAIRRGAVERYQRSKQ